ncbi:hypothetical protein PWY87_33220 [Kribbella solani]|uniref:hypothetical protein n=1 Tax=Kribbella solani TaxID=236067 RepID=UPI0029B1E2EA|nr:hypothetical protein [Kribbella solani]MDX3006583.1 hypothetical protein [Kribbella solani]
MDYPLRIELNINVGRLVNRIPRRRRCDSCRTRMDSKIYGPADSRRPRNIESPTEGPGTRYLCDTCNDRSRAAHEAFAAQMADELAQMVRSCTIWLEHAPLIHELPDPIDQFSSTSWISPTSGSRWYEFEPRHCFVQVLEIMDAAEQCARAVLGYDCHGLRLQAPAGALRHVPTQHNDALTHLQYDEHDTYYRRRITWTGSIHQLAGSHIVFHWHTRQDCIN